MRRSRVAAGVVLALLFVGLGVAVYAWVHAPIYTFGAVPVEPVPYWDRLDAVAKASLIKLAWWDGAYRGAVAATLIIVILSLLVGAVLAVGRRSD